MTLALPPKNLPILLGVVRQEGTDGELVLEQNDGVRTFYLNRGELIHLKSDVAGEQFGNYLLRQGILDFQALSELLQNDERYRLGEKVIQWGMMSLEERDCHLQALQEQIMIHALEHPIVSWTWNPGPMDNKLEQDLHFKLQHRHFVWNTFSESHYLTDLLDTLEKESAWHWEGRRDLLDSLTDLPLTPGTAYALSFLGADPISFTTFRSLSNLEEEEAGRFLATLWALGALVLEPGHLALVPAPEPAPEPAPAPAAEALHAGLPLILPPPGSTPRKPLPPLELDPTPVQPEFLDLEPEPQTPQPQAYAQTMPPQPPPYVPPQPPPYQRPEPFLPPPDPFQPRTDPAPARSAAQVRPDPFARPEAVPQPAYAPPQATYPPPQAPPPSFPAGPPAMPEPQAPPSGPARAKALVRSAKQQASREHTVEAIRTLEQAVKLEPEPEVAYEAWLLLGQLRLANPAWSTRAIDALQNAARIRPRAAEPWATMGELYHRKGFSANAAACFRKALDLDPSVPLPPDVDLEAKAEPAPAAPSRKGLFSKLKSVLGGSD